MKMKRRKFRQKRHEVVEEDVNTAGAKVRRVKKRRSRDEFV